MAQRKGKEDFQRYVKLDDEMTDSAAWGVLSPGAILVYIELRKKYNHANGGNSRLILPKSEILWRMKDVTFAKRKKELIERGFIDCVDPGGLPQRPAIYRLSDRWKAISRELVTTRSREAIRSGLVKKPLAEKYSKTILNLQKKEGMEKDIHRNILKGAPKKGAYKRALQAPKKGAYDSTGVNREKSLGSKKGGLVGSKKGGLRSKDKRDIEGKKKLTKAQLIDARNKSKEWGIKYTPEEEDAFQKVIEGMRDN